MLQTLSRIVPGILLIVLLSGLLLAYDRMENSNVTEGEISISVFLPVSRPDVEDMLGGMMVGLREQGFEPGKNLRIRLYNAEGDAATAAGIASAIVADRPRLAVAMMTPCLQAMASANRSGAVPFVFFGVTDPFGAGVRVTTQSHPPYMTGFGTSQPVREAFELARSLYPGLKSIGAPWNPSEVPSQFGLKRAREVCRRLGITLLEAPVENSAAVSEACKALIARGAQALWVPPDNTVMVATETMVRDARAGRIPVFGSIPGQATLGCLFGHGSADEVVGRLGGLLVADVLHGKPTSSIPVKDVVPMQVAYNLKALEGLRDPWRVPPDLLKTAYFVIGADGKKRGPDRIASAAVSTHRWSIHVIDYTESLTIEDVHRGLFDELPKQGLVEGRDYDVKRACAQGDVATLTGLVQAAVGAKVDMIVATSTPSLQASITRTKGIPIVFTSVASGVLAGAGKSVTDHLPNVTGSTSESDWVGMVRLIREAFPSAKRVGTLFAPSEINSVYYREQFEKALASAGLQLITAPVSGTSDVADAAQALAGKVEVFCQISDNTANASFSAITRAARRSHVPLLAFASQAVTKDGAAIAHARDYEDAGRACAILMGRVIRGALPATIPFEPLRKTSLVVSRKNAAACGFTIPASILKRADKVVN